MNNHAFVFENVFFLIFVVLTLETIEKLSQLNYF